jgi:RNA polymerase sigma-70 factor (ECF subfamily)
MKKLLPIDCTLFNQGNAEHYWLVYERFYRVVRKYAGKFIANQVDAEQITFQIFSRLWDKTNKNFEKEQQILSYLYVVTHNACINYLKRTEGFSTWYFGDEIMGDDGDTEGLEEIETEMNRIFHLVIQRMSAQRQKVLNMKYRDGLDVIEIARMLDLSPSTVYSHLRHAHDDFKKIFPGLKDVFKYLALLTLMAIWKLFKNN